MSVCKVKLNRNTAIFHFGVCICTPVPPENALTIKHHYTQEYQEYYVHIVYNLCAWVEPNSGFLIKIRSRKLGFSHWLFPKLRKVIYWISIIRAIVGVLIRQFVSLGTNEQRKLLCSLCSNCNQIFLPIWANIQCMRLAQANMNYWSSLHDPSMVYKFVPVAWYENFATKSIIIRTCCQIWLITSIHGSKLVNEYSIHHPYTIKTCVQEKLLSSTQGWGQLF